VSLRARETHVDCDMPNKIQSIATVLLAAFAVTAFAQERFNPARDGFKIETKSRNGKGVEVINGVPQNVDSDNLKRKAEAGDPKAQADLAVCLYDGKHGIAADNVGAYKWATVAASQGSKEAKYLVREMQIILAKDDLVQGQAAAKRYLDKQKPRKD